MIKSSSGSDTALVVFKLPATVTAVSVSVCGEFNDWSPATHPLTPTDDGHFRASVELAVGRRWRFRYLLDGERWENDWATDDYVPNAHGGEDSVVDLTDICALPSAPTLPPPAADLGRTDPRAVTVSAEAAPNAEPAPATAGARAKAGKAAPPATARAVVQQKPS